jgi:hypothetical protein
MAILDCEVEIVIDLYPRLKELDGAMLRWYIEKDGEHFQRSQNLVGCRTLMKRMCLN